MARFIYLGCIVALTVLYFGIKLYRAETVAENDAEDFQLPELYLRRGEFESRRRSHRTNSEMCFETRAEIANWAIRSLPPVKRFECCQEDIIMHCPICMEEFKRGSLIQSFGVCAHEFHTACLNSWLQRGKSTCPVCRLDLFV
jgi:hypothetical protein